jgi:hypothetical protein
MHRGQKMQFEQRKRWGHPVNLSPPKSFPSPVQSGWAELLPPVPRTVWLLKHSEVLIVMHCCLTVVFNLQFLMMKGMGIFSRLTDTGSFFTGEVFTSLATC